MKAYYNWNTDLLVNECTNRGLSTDGDNIELMTRLIQHDRVKRNSITPIFSNDQDGKHHIAHIQAEVESRNEEAFTIVSAKIAAAQSEYSKEIADNHKYQDEETKAVLSKVKCSNADDHATANDYAIADNHAVAAQTPLPTTTIARALGSGISSKDGEINRVCGSEEKSKNKPAAEKARETVIIIDDDDDDDDDGSIQVTKKDRASSDKLDLQSKTTLPPSKIWNTQITQEGQPKPASSGSSTAPPIFVPKIQRLSSSAPLQFISKTQPLSSSAPPRFIPKLGYGIAAPTKRKTDEEADPRAPKIRRAGEDFESGDELDLTYVVDDSPIQHRLRTPYIHVTIPGYDTKLGYMTMLECTMAQCEPQGLRADKTGYFVIFKNTPAGRENAKKCHRVYNGKEWANSKIVTELFL